MTGHIIPPGPEGLLIATRLLLAGTSPAEVHAAFHRGHTHAIADSLTGPGVDLEAAEVEAALTAGAHCKQLADRSLEVAAAAAEYFAEFGVFPMPDWAQ